MKSIRQQREECGWTLQEAADACGVSLEVWNRFEAGDKGFFAGLPIAWEIVTTDRLFDRYGWITGDWPLDSVGPC